jgi:hypothetical protein
VHEEMQAGEFPRLDGAESRDVAGVPETNVRQQLVIVHGTQVRMVAGLERTHLAEHPLDKIHHLLTRPPQGRGNLPAAGALYQEAKHLYLDQRQLRRRPRGLAHDASVGPGRGVERLEPRGQRIILKVQEGAGLGYWWVTRGVCEISWQVWHYAAETAG